MDDSQRLAETAKANEILSRENFEMAQNISRISGNILDLVKELGEKAKDLTEGAARSALCAELADRLTTVLRG